MERQRSRAADLGSVWPGARIVLEVVILGSDRDIGSDRSDSANQTSFTGVGRPRTQSLDLGNFGSR
jgi:hypothetical protein